MLGRRMSLAAGSRIGPYEVTAQIGEGGMGKVWRAHHTGLKRDDALKVLPDAFASDPDRLARFRREAQVLASLNHPNIAHVYGLEQSDGMQALVMELVEGPTLADRIAQGPIPVDEALPIAKQIAEALEAAHEQGIIHRDLKPANVKVRPDGTVKVLDFGLAKALDSSPAAIDASHSPTITSPAMMTGVGVLLGTAAYMSPEQARGKGVTRATDIFAFGAVLYEMLTGSRAFQGEDTADVLAAVMKTEPDWSKLPAHVPLAIRTLLHRCLRKERQHRLADAGSVRIELEDILAATPADAVTFQEKRSSRLPALALSIAGLVVTAAIAGLAVWRFSPASQPLSVTRFTITLPPGDQLSGLDRPAVAVSPDGRQLAYVAVREGLQRVYLRAMDALESKPLAGTDGAANIFFSPDGQWLGFYADGAYKKVPVSGGAALTLSAAGLSPQGASWGEQGTILFADAQSLSLRLLPDTGGAVRPATRLREGDLSHRWPEFLPGGDAFLFAGGPIQGSLIAVQALASTEPKNLIENGTSPRYAPSGHLLYAQGANLMVVPFDAERTELTGEPVPVIEGVLHQLNGSVQYSISRTGSLVYLSGGLQGAQRRPVWVSRNGTEQPLPVPVRAYESPRLSPDGQRLAIAAGGQIWLYDLSRETQLTRFTFEGNLNNRPVWTPDGERIAFYSDREGPLNLYWQRADGSGGLERLITADHTQVPHSWSPDGQLLAFQDVSPAVSDTWILNLSDRKARPLLQTPFGKTNPRFSPDGQWIAYQSNQSGRDEIYVRPYPGPGGQWLVSTNGGTEPVWKSNGRELFYREGNRMMAAEIVTQPSFSAGRPRLLFEGQYASVLVGVPNYDVSPDGQRFLMIKQSEQATPVTQINVVLNWTEELKRLVPAN